MALSLTIRSWWTPKAGHEVSEYEDAYRIADPTDDAPLRIAVADGATGATYSALWAELLATDYAKGFLTTESIAARVPLLANAWAVRVQAEPLPWYAQAKVSSEGSYAALLGMTLDPETGAYSVLCVGDCSLIHLRPLATDSETFSAVLAIPYQRADDFTHSPLLIGTQPKAQRNIVALMRTVQGTVRPGDRLYLMSDALAAWFLREMETERAPWKWLAPLHTARSEDTLAIMIRELRDMQRLKNDDVTVVSVQVG